MLWRGRVTRTFQNLELFEAMTVLENVLVSDHTRQRAGFWGAALCTPWAMRSERQARARAMEMLRDIGIEALWHRPARLLSFGQRKLLELARALVSRPKLLLLDEPASGLSLSYAVCRCGPALWWAHGVAIVLIEHVIKLVHEVCARVTVLEQGQVIAAGTPAEIQHHPQVLQAYLGQQMPGAPRYARQHTARRVDRDAAPTQDISPRVLPAPPWCWTLPGWTVTTARCKCCGTSRCVCMPERSWPCWGAMVPGNRRCCAPCQGWCARVEARCSLPDSTSRDDARSAWCDAALSMCRKAATSFPTSPWRPAHGGVSLPGCRCRGRRA